MLSLADKAVERALTALEHNDVAAAQEVLDYERQLTRWKLGSARVISSG